MKAEPPLPEDSTIAHIEQCKDCPIRQTCVCFDPEDPECANYIEGPTHLLCKRQLRMWLNGSWGKRQVFLKGVELHVYKD